MSFNQLSISVSGIGGPIVGGMLFGFVSMEWFLFINILSYIIAFSLEATMNFKLYTNQLEEPTSIEESMLQSFKEGFTYLKTKPVILRILIVSLWLNLFLSSVSVGINFILVEILKVEYSLIGFIEAAAAIGMLFISLYFAARTNVKYPLQFSKRALFMLGILVGVMTIPLIFHFSSSAIFIYFLAVMFSFGCLTVLTNTPIMVMMQKDVDESYRGRIFGILEMMAMGLMPIGSLIFGILYDVLPAQIILLFCSASLIIITLVAIPRSLIMSIYPNLKKNTSELEQPLFKNT